MANGINFVKAFIRKAETKHSEAGAFVRIHLTSEFTDHVLESMAWTDPGESSKKTRMAGELAEGTFILTPDSDMLNNQEIQFSFQSAAQFDIVTLEDEDSKRRELRFIVDSTAAEAADHIRGYMNMVKKSTGALKLNYAVQGDLGL